MDKQGVMQFGVDAWSEWNRMHPVTDPLTSCEAWINDLRRRGLDGDMAAATRFAVLSRTDAQIMVLLSGAWAHYGFRQIVTGHRFAAALMATSVTKSIVEALLPPWECFAIDLPDGLVWFDSVDGPIEGKYVLVRYGWAEVDGVRGNRWSFCMFGPDAQALWSMHRTAADLCSGVGLGDTVSPFSTELTKMDERAAVLVWRMIVGVCLAMEDRTSVKESKAAKRNGMQRGCKEPVARTYIIGRVPKVDCRVAVREYALGKSDRRSGPVTVQVLVAGHWKSHWWPKEGVHKRTHIEPYWRGPEDAPILVKARIVEEEKP